MYCIYTVSVRIAEKMANMFSYIFDFCIILVQIVLKLKLLYFLLSQKLINSCSCQDLNLGPPREQAAMLTIEL